MMVDSVEPGLPKRPIRLLVVEDSPSIREFLVYLFASDQEIQVIGTASNGEEALEVVRAKKPDVITMDIHMPKMDGFAATRAIMESFPTPIVIVTDSKSVGGEETPISALEAGALAVIKRPTGIGHPDHTATARELIQTVKLMSEIKVVRRWVKQRERSMATPDNHAAMSLPTLEARKIRLVAIGASTGGPLVLQQIFSRLPKDFPVPIIVVQHIADGFTEGFSEWLMESTGFSIKVAVDGELMIAGHVYIAPKGYQTTVNRHGCIVLKKDPPENGHYPSVSCLFRSVAAVYGSDAIGILLTGMGKDGAIELGLMKSAGAITIAQDKETSVVHGMPGEAITLGASTYVLAPDKMSALLGSMTRSEKVER